MTNPLPVADVATAGRAVLDEVATAVVGMREPLRVALAAVLASGHVLFEDVPGLGKTLAARSLATALGLEFRRVQCTPDLLPSDITGSSVFDPATTSFEFRPGPVFAGLLLADE
ncbi:MAG TPA: AAA family ATPase, partial [Cellulomonas sp.]|nr:AAA family ATPase [Cellulomonas sp.]